MAKNIDEIIASLDAGQRKAVKARAKELISEQLTLQELRRARKLTQVHLAKTLKVAQKQISAIEKRTDLHISKLRRSIEAMGGRLYLVATFPDRKPITLAGLADPESGQPKARKSSRLVRLLPQSFPTGTLHAPPEPRGPAYPPAQ